MAEVKWIKIVTDIFDDEKILLIESLPDADSVIVIWFKLLCLAGKNNNKGVFTLNDRIAYTDEMLSTIFRRQLNTVRMALEIFKKYGMIEIVNGVITIPNWGKHQTLDQIENRREYQRQYMYQKRQEQKLLAECKPNSKPNSKPNVSPIEVDIDIEEDKNKKDSINTRFAEFWSVYPKKAGKGAAEKSFQKIRPSEELLNTMIQAVNTQKRSKDWLKDNGQFIPNPSTWLNQKRWEDSLEEGAKTNAVIRPDSRSDKYAHLYTPK